MTFSAVHGGPGQLSCPHWSPGSLTALLGQTGGAGALDGGGICIRVPQAETGGKRHEARRVPYPVGVP